MTDDVDIVVQIEAQKAAFDNGFRVDRGADGPWLHFGSTTARGDVWITAPAPGGPWFLSLSHSGVAAEFGGGTSGGPGIATFSYASLQDLHDAIARAYRLGVSLPDAPLHAFQEKTRDLPRTTEIERTAVQRVGQDIFRYALLRYWNECCPMTGITEPALLRASHIVPWSKCESDAQRLDVHNGLLLSSLWDAAFDSGLVSFTDDGDVLFSPRISAPSRELLLAGASTRLSGLTLQHKANLAVHRRLHGFESA